MGVFEQFPYANMHEMNLDWLLKKMKELAQAMETFKATESLKFADPIIWDITTQYQKSTVVLDPTGNAYLSLQTVPAGVQLNNADYWLEIFNFTDYTRTANRNLTVNVETNTTRATAAYQVDDWLIWEDVLYRVTAAIAIDDALIVAPDAGSNIIHFTVEDFIKAFITYATNLINQYKNDIDASELAYRQQLAQDIASTTASLQAQLNAAIAGATVDSEVINARVGYNNVTYPTLGDAIRTQISDINNELNAHGWYKDKASPNNRWPRVALNVISDHTYVLQVLNIESADAIEICMLTQGSTTFSSSLHNGQPISFTPSGADPVYMAVRYAAAPSVTPVITYKLTELTGSEYLRASITTIEDSNKTSICNGDCDNIPINIITRVKGSLLHAPFDSGFYDIITFGKFISISNGDIQIAISEDSKQIKSRQYVDSWSLWESISQDSIDLINNISNAQNIYGTVTAANGKYPRTVLPVINGNSYIIKILGIINTASESYCYINQGGSVLTTTALNNKAAQIFTTAATSDPVYLTVEYATAPTEPPMVVYELIPANMNRNNLTASNLIISDSNKAAICNGDADNIPLNLIIGKTGSTTIDNDAFINSSCQIISLGKYLSKTSGDLQIALKTAANTIAYRAYNGSVFSPWKFITPVSRFSGRKFAVIGDSISTFDQNAYKYPDYKMAYPYLNVNTVDLTWWMRVISASGAELDVNASWSGSCVTDARSSETYGALNYPTFYDRCGLLDNPDVIFVALGTNDSIVGTSLLNPGSPRVQLGSYDYTTPYTSLSEATFRTAYIKGIKALQHNYPNAKIVCILLYMNNDLDYAGSVISIAQTLGCDLVDCRGYKIADSSVHPDIKGMRDISSKILYPETALF